MSRVGFIVIMVALVKSMLISSVPNSEPCHSVLSQLAFMLALLVYKNIPTRVPCSAINRDKLISCCGKMNYQPN
jgi:hypothetical protein